MSTDAELLQRYIRENSETAFAGLVQRHLSLVYSSALRQVNGDVHLAKDVSQTVFIALARKAPSLVGRATLAGWLYLGTHHAAAQAVRGNRRREAREQEAHAMQEALGTPVPAADWDGVRPVLDEAMRELGETDREAVLLRFFEQRPFADIGAALNLTEDAARMRIERALDKLHALLARRGITSTTAALAVALTNQAMVAVPAGFAASVTGAARANTTAAGAGFFMNTTTTVVSILAAVAIALGIYQVGQTRRAEDAAAAIGRERDALRAQMREARQQAAQAEQQVASLRRQGESPSVGRATSVTPKTEAAKPGVTLIGAVDPLGGPPRNAHAIVNTPEGRKAAMNEALDVKYAAFFRQLGFTPAQREQFKVPIIEWKERGQEIFEAAMAQGVAPDHAMQTWAKQSGVELEAKQRSLLGETAFESLKHYEATGALRNMTDQLATALFNTPSPLTVEQADQVVEIMAAHTRNARGRIDVLVMNNDMMLAQAQSVLSPPQIDALRKIAEQAQLYAKATKNMGRSPPIARPPGN